MVYGLYRYQNAWYKDKNYIGLFNDAVCNILLQKYLWMKNEKCRQKRLRHTTLFREFVWTEEYVYFAGQF